jgi:hypothetical protein
MTTDIIIREPDMIDPIMGTVSWIGEDVAVEVPSEMLTRMVLHAEFATQYARNGWEPERMGIKVTTYGRPFRHVIHSYEGPDHRKTARPSFITLDSKWRAVREALGHDHIEVERKQIVALLDENQPMTEAK